MANCQDFAPLSKKSTVLKNAAAMFGELITAVDELPLNALLDLVLEKTGYMDYLKTLENADSKIENVNELRTSVMQYMEQAEEPTLGGFLEETALYTEADSDDGSNDRILLMTVHSAKGLEFDNVFVAGMEDGIFPGARSMYSEEDLEEERRLAYVAITRARKKLWVTSAGRRMIFGQTQKNVTSRFIREIGKENFIKLDNSKRAAQGADDVVTEVQSLSLQQQLAREKRNSSSASTDTNSYQPGERVAHRIFGEGTVLTVTKMANDSMLEVAFEKVGTKKIMANFAKLKMLN